MRGVGGWGGTARVHTHPRLAKHHSRLQYPETPPPPPLHEVVDKNACVTTDSTTAFFVSVLIPLRKSRSSRMAHTCRLVHSATATGSICARSSIRSKSSSVAAVASCPKFVGLRRLDNGSKSGSEGFGAVLGAVSSSSTSSSSARGIVSMGGTGKFFVGGNWKCNGNSESIKKLVDDLNSAKLEDDVDVVVAPPFVYIPQVVSTLTKRIDVAGQNSWTGKGGAFTGEISADMLADVGSKWVILGHSERRHILGESSDTIGKKSAYAATKDLGIIACVGEKLEERESGRTLDVVSEQLQAFADSLPDWSSVVVAYEPVWAIGTGKVATPEQAQEVHAAIRKWLSEKVSPEVASKTRIIYGGSVNGANSSELAKREDIDGFLVGGASLKGPEFATIVNSVTSKKKVAA